MSGYGPNYSQAPYTREVYASVARTATPTAVEVVNDGQFNACYIFVSVTAAAATPSVVFNFEIYNRKGDSYVEVLDSAAVTGISENVYFLGAGAEVADLATVFVPSDKIRISPVHADADSITYSVAVRWLRI
jgi:hypothetical protein